MLKIEQMSGLLFLGVAVSVLSSCQQINPSSEGGNEASETVLELLNDASELPTNLFLAATNTGWQVTPIDTDQELNLTYGTYKAPTCQSENVPIVSLPSHRTLTLSLTSFKSLSEDKHDFPRICVKTWDINEELIPGLIQNFQITTSAPQAVCAICYDKDGQIIPRSTIRFEIKSVQQ